MRQQPCMLSILPYAQCLLLAACCTTIGLGLQASPQPCGASRMWKLPRFKVHIQHSRKSTCSCVFEHEPLSCRRCSLQTLASSLCPAWPSTPSSIGSWPTSHTGRSSPPASLHPHSSLEDALGACPCCSGHVLTLSLLCPHAAGNTACKLLEYALACCCYANVAASCVEDEAPELVQIIYT